MTLAQIKTMFIEILSSWFSNKKVLDKLSEDDNGYVTYDNKPIADITKLNQINKYQKYLNTDLDYGVFEVTKMTFNNTIPLVFSYVINGNMELSENGYIKLHAGKTYIFHIGFYTGGDSSTSYNTGYFLVDSELNVLSDAQTSSTGSYIYKASKDIEVTFISDGTNTHVMPAWSCVNVHEINRQITIDPVEHVNESQGLEDTPVGHIISHMGTIAPKHYLVCDGTEYNISNYPYLAQHIIDNFGSVNYFGGDGTTTFAVPDLRGEFLRGTGTATRNTGSGEEVGKHQDGTEHADTLTNSQYSIAAPRRIWGYGANRDSIVNSIETYNATTNIVTNTLSGGGTFTSRPTNTSVLYCIKYEPTYFMNMQLSPALYSEEEQIIGRWIDGKPLYRKVVKIITNNNNTSKIIETNIVNGSNCRIVDGYINGSNNYNHPLNFRTLGVYSFFDCYNDGSKIYCATDANVLFNCIAYVILEYTKTTDTENSFSPEMLFNITNTSSIATDKEVQEVIGGI